MVGSCFSFLQPIRARFGRQPCSNASPLGQVPSSDLLPLGERDRASRSLADYDYIPSYKYDVFISFRGPDTRNKFVDHLYNHLIRKGIFVFKDDKQLQKGESISPQLLQAIEDSRVSIVVFSKDYASSTWCLDEMDAIEMWHRRLQQTVFPVFYDVDPSDVRKQKGAYENAFLLHAEQSNQGYDKVSSWKIAMTRLAELGGWDVRNKPEFDEIENIVQAVIKELGHKFSSFANDLIGIQPRVQELEGLLKLSSRNDKFRVLGIWGMSGIGKTALATALYDRISYQFSAGAFIENASKIYKEGGIAALHKQILQQTMDEKNLHTYNHLEISGIVKNRLHKIKLLLILDNVDQFVQLQELNIDPKLLCAGSRIIITTRDKHILIEYGADEVHEVQLMNDNDARELLHKKAFKNNYFSSNSTEMIPETLNYAQGLPLAIKVMGSFLCHRDVEEWRATLNRLQNNPLNGIMEVLQISVEGLETNEREIFLHVACFFKGDREDYVRRILDACGLHPRIGIPLIAEKSLITIRNQEIHMHDLLQDLGKQIVRKQYLDETECWSRLWLYQDFYRVMTTKTEARKVKAIVLDQKEDDVGNELRAENLSKMTHLTLLIICHKNFSGKLISLSNYLRYLSWNGYPFTSLPSQFQPYELVELNMSDSSIEKLWEGITAQHLPHLKRIDLSNSRNLRETPSFERMQNLERLDFNGCINLLEVHPSIGLLKKLIFLNLRNCCSLVNLNFGSDLPRLPSLGVLLLSGCTKLENTPNFNEAINLEYLDIDQCTSLSALHESLVNCRVLGFLSLRDCINLVELPDIFCSMNRLITLDLSGCLKFMHPPFGQVFRPHHRHFLISLDLSFCNISEIPDGIGELSCLEKLNLQGNNFVKLPSTTKDLYNLAYLNLSHCSNLEDVPQLPYIYDEEGGRYFKRFGSRDHRSGLYIFNCPMLAKECDWWSTHSDWNQMMRPHYFRDGFDIVSPWHWEDDCFPGNLIIPQWFGQRFEGGSVIRPKHFGTHPDWVGVVFCVAFEVNNPLGIVGSTHQSPLPHPFYLSFESEHTEERFDMPLSLELNKINGSKYLWTIYISWEHCHFVKTRSQITFKARQGLTIKEWGLRLSTQEDRKWPYKIHMSLEEIMLPFRFDMFHTHIPIDIVREGSSSNKSTGPKIQLPYNWLVSDEVEVENDEAKKKELYLFNLGLEAGRTK